MHGQNKPKFVQNLFHTILNNSINKKTAPEKRRKKPKAVKDRGGRVGGRVRGRFDRGQRFNVFFFKPSLTNLGSVTKKSENMGKCSTV